MLSLGATCLAFLAAAFTPRSGSAASPAPPTDGLAELLAAYDRAPSRELEARIDRAAGQRYATVSRLSWYTDLDEAKRAAAQTGRPILALRMLGDLRVDLSCANSRLFRSVLYANAEVSAFLRDHVVLYWSSERPAPKITIDYGDGRTLETTITGNSIHYVLDARGRVVDALPGMYAPSVFVAELRKSVALEKRLRGLPDTARHGQLGAHHAEAARRIAAAWKAMPKIHYLPHDNELGAPQARLAAAAQRATMSKRMMEAPTLVAIGALRARDVPDDTAAWAAIGQRVWRFPAPAPRATPFAEPASTLLDAPSRALVRRLIQPDNDHTFARQVAALEHSVVADTAINELSLRPAIHAQLAHEPEMPLEDLNAWVYADVFSTPASDPWMGLAQEGVFTGLPGNGVVNR